MTMTSISAFQLVLPSNPADTSTRTQNSSTSSMLNMVEKKKPKSTRGGFGHSSITKNNNNVKKTRIIKGKHIGAGTKALAAAANTFDRIRKLHGKEGTSDVYVRSPKNDESVFWFVGKVVRMMDNNCMEEDSDVVDTGMGAENNNTETKRQLLAGSVYPTISEAILSQKRLILEYAKCELRPQNMGLPQYAPHLELWAAPGDSEMDVARNHVVLVKIDGSSMDLREGFNVNDVGYNPEVRLAFFHRFAFVSCFLSLVTHVLGVLYNEQIYVGEEKEKGGFRVVRDLEGRPVKPVFDINV